MDRKRVLVASMASMSIAAAAAAVAARGLGSVLTDVQDHFVSEGPPVGRMFHDMDSIVPYGDDSLLGYADMRTRSYGRSGGQQKSRDVPKGRRAAKAARKARRITRHAK